ncbi:hypothetical protein K0U27_10545 [archaeon]|nr:hypothetical protein [archaeon]
MKTSSYLTIIILIILAISIAFTILFAENVRIKDIHGNSSIPENDLKCGTEWTVKMRDNLDLDAFEKTLRAEIAEFGYSYDISQRDITLVNLGDDRVHITIEGLWGIEPDRPNLKTSIAGIEQVEQIEEFEGGPVVAWCQ